MVWPRSRVHRSQRVRDPDVAGPASGVGRRASLGETTPAPPSSDDSAIPTGMRVAAGWSWRVLVLGVLVVAVGWVLAYLSEVSVSLFVGILLTAALWPSTNWLSARGLPRSLAAALSLLLLALIVGGIFSLVGAQIAGQWTELVNQAVVSFNQLMTWIPNGPLHISNTQLDKWIDEAIATVTNSRSTIASYASQAGRSLGHFVAGAALALFATFFFLYDGRKISDTAVMLIPRQSRPRLQKAAGVGWVSLVSYVRAAILVAFVDGLGAGIGAAALGSSMWLAIGALTFITAFVPLLGALTAGVVSAAVIFVTLGWLKAVMMVGIFTLVMEIEAHVLQPFLLGKAVSVHPLAVLYALSIGFIIGGIVGGLFAIPLLAFGNAFVRALNPEVPGLGVPPAQGEQVGETAKTA